MRTALAAAPMRFPLQLDAASAREIRENSTGGGPVHYDVPSGERGVSIEMNAKTPPGNADRTIQFQDVTYGFNGRVLTRLLTTSASPSLPARPSSSWAAAAAAKPRF